MLVTFIYWSSGFSSGRWLRVVGCLGISIGATFLVFLRGLISINIFSSPSPRVSFGVDGYSCSIDFCDAAVARVALAISFFRLVCPPSYSLLFKMMMMMMMMVFYQAPSPSSASLSILSILSIMSICTLRTIQLFVSAVF